LTGATLQSGQHLARFCMVAVAGLAVDMAIAWALNSLLVVPLTLAAIVSFTVAAGFNYLAHEFWTFGIGGSLSAKRGGLYLVTLGITLAARLAVIVLVQRAFSLQPGQALVALVPAVGISFVVSFLLSKYLVFDSSGRRSSTLMTMAAGPVDTTDWAVPAATIHAFGDKRHHFVLVIPVINEGERIRGQLRRIAAANLPVDVVVADGGSTDGSLDEAFLTEVGLRALLVKQGPGWLSAQLRMAYAWCLEQGYDGIVTIDGNGKDNIEAVSSFVDKLRAGYDYVQGSRYRPGGKAENTPLERTIGNRFIHAPVMSIAGRRWFTDTTNGFRAYSARYLLDPRVKPFRDIFMNYELLFYLTARAGQIGGRVCEIGVQRSYPLNAKTPTKIVGFRSKFGVFEQLIAAAIGKHHP
jgi:dolichol-phosphate mannosyltransferase